MNDPNDLVTVAKFQTPAEAELAKERLEAEGIPVFLKNEMAVGVMPYLGSALGGIELQVPERDTATARDLLEPPSEDDQDGEDDDEDPPIAGA